jgi:hypothetical protein
LLTVEAKEEENADGKDNSYEMPESVNFCGGVAGKRAWSCGDIVDDGGHR